MVRVGWVVETPRWNLVDNAAEKQDAKNLFRRLALPSEVDSVRVLSCRSTGMRHCLGDSLLKFFQNSWGEFILEVSDLKKQDLAALRAEVVWFLIFLNLSHTVCVAVCLPDL